jgi:spore coat protein H
MRVCQTHSADFVRKCAKLVFPIRELGGEVKLRRSWPLNWHLSCFCLAVLGLVMASTTSCSKRPGGPTADRGLSPTEDLFTTTNVPRIRIEIARADVAILRRTSRSRGQTRPSVQAIVREGRTVYTNVAVHLKGAMGSFRPFDDNPGFTLNFQKYAPGQSFHGLHKLSLNNSVQDPSLLTERMCRELFEAAGVPVPRAAHAKLEVNGRDLGVRVLTEGFGKQFLKRYFANAKGNLYDGGFVQDITARLAVNSGDNPQDRSGLDALVEAAREPDATKRFARLEDVLDMDRFLSLLAMDVMLCDWDGYAMNRNNWRIFHDLGSHKMVFFPHGLDQMFGVVRARPEMSILPPMRGLVAIAVLSTPEGRSGYYKRMEELYTEVFHMQAILKRVDELTAVIHPIIAESGADQAGRHDRAVQRLKERIILCDQSLQFQLDALASGQVPREQPLRFPSNRGPGRGPERRRP